MPKKIEMSKEDELKEKWRNARESFLKKVDKKQYIRRKTGICVGCVWGGLNGRQVCIRPGCNKGG